MLLAADLTIALQGQAHFTQACCVLLLYSIAFHGLSSRSDQHMSSACAFKILGSVL